MPKRSDIKSILLIGAGPIVIGQACEFDYSGTQACKALKEEGYRVILVNSNPATIMTDPSMADATYIEPVCWQTVAKIIEQERPDAILPTMGGQTALNCALDLAREGVLKKYGVELIGATKEAIDKAEDRSLFREAMQKIGLAVPQSVIAHTLAEAYIGQAEFGYPCIIRPSFTLGGSGGGIAYNHEEFEQICQHGLELSPTTEILVEESVLGWKEFELEVVRDCNDNCIIICAIENIDPMGVHTGDSITVAPAQTLTDKEYQLLRDASISVLREIGVDTGGSNVQFALNPEDGRIVVIEMNPRVSRSSALASKATGFPIAKVAAKLAVGYTLDELQNEITGGVIPVSFEPTIDYVVTKIPRFNFEKFPQADAKLTTQMKAVGEVMAIGRTFQESLQKALASLETNLDGFSERMITDYDDAKNEIRAELKSPKAERILYIADALRSGFDQAEIHQITQIDPWFIQQIAELILLETTIRTSDINRLTEDDWWLYKQKGFSDSRLALLLDSDETEVRQRREALGVVPAVKRVDSCAGEFTAVTDYLYLTYEKNCECFARDTQKVMILGGGPNRIGQGIEFDYCCVHAALALRERGFETIMVNCNPETVSTDFDTSDRLYFEPLTFEHVLDIVNKEKPIGVIVQYGGQTPLKLAQRLQQAGVPIIGTSPDAIDNAEDRKQFQQTIEALKLKQPPSGTVYSVAEGYKLAAELSYPLMVRPSYVLGGRAMEVVYNDGELQSYLQRALLAADKTSVLIDRFLDNAIEVDVDAVSDGENVVIAAIMEHIEQAGVHSGDSACSIPTLSLTQEQLTSLQQQTCQLAKALHVIGLINVQFAIQNGEIYVLEVNPRASRTIPFVSKVTGISFAKVAACCMVGISLAEQKVTEHIIPEYYSVKLPVFPFIKFNAVDPILGPEMKSTGEVMGMGASFAEAYAKSQLGAGASIPKQGNAFLSVRDADKEALVPIAQELIKAGFKLFATRGTASVLMDHGVEISILNKVMEGRPHVVDMIKNGEIQLIVNTTEGKQAIADSSQIRRTALQYKVFYTTTVAGAKAIIQAFDAELFASITALQHAHQQESIAQVQ